MKANVKSHGSVRRSAFDYAITVARRSRYLVVSCPDLGLHAGSQCLLLDQLSPAQLGEAVLRMYERVRAELDRISSLGLDQPAPFALKREQALTATQAAKALGVTPFILRRLADQGEVAFERTPGGHRRFQVEELTRYLLTRERSTVVAA